MTRAVVLSAVRTPVGRYGGGLAGVRPDDLAAIAVAAAVERAGVPAGEIEDVWLGCANQAGEDNRNVARFAALLAGLPDSVAGVTVNRLCASGLSAVVGACHAVIAGDGDLFVAGGVESMTRAPLVTAKPDAPYARGNRTIYDTTLGWRFTNPRYEERFSSASMGETGENVAERWAVSREDQDAFALRSQQRWAEADAAGRFADELVPGRRARARRAPTPGHHRGEARVAEARLPLRGDGHGRERERDQRRRGGAGDRERGAGTLARRGAARSVRRLGGRRRRPRGHGDRPGARRPQAARARGPHRGGPRPRRAERGVRVAVARRRPRARARRGARERERRRDRDRASARHERGTARRELCCTSCGGGAAATGSRRCASVSGRGRRRCSSDRHEPHTGRDRRRGPGGPDARSPAPSRGDRLGDPRGPQPRVRRGADPRRRPRARRRPSCSTRPASGSGCAARASCTRGSSSSPGASATGSPSTS